MTSKDDRSLQTLDRLLSVCHIVLSIFYGMTCIHDDMDAKLDQSNGAHEVDRNEASGLSKVDIIRLEVHARMC